MKPASPPPYDPAFLHARREAWVIFFIWLAALLWSVPYCYRYGYVESFDGAAFSTTFGIPSWLFWGIGAPWLAANVATTLFCFGFMQDDDLGDSPEEIAEKNKPSQQEPPA